MRSWKTSASESVFSVHLPSLDTQQSTAIARGAKEIQQRNRRPCGRCSRMQKKCDIAPPYSPTRCGSCTKANIPSCPPYKARRSCDSKRGSRTRISRKEQTPSISSRPAAPQSHYLEVDAATVFPRPVHQSEAKEVENPSRNSEASGLGFGSTDVSIAPQPAPLMQNSVSFDLDQMALGGGIDAIFSLFSAGEYLAESEDLTNAPGLAFPVTFAPAFLPSL